MNELALLVDEYINNKGIKYNFIADKLDISRQALYQLFRKKNFNIDDANRILSVIGYKIDYAIKPLWYKISENHRQSNKKKSINYNIYTLKN